MHGPAPMVRLPLKPLIDFAELRYGDERTQNETALAAMFRLLGVSPRNIWRWQRDGVTERMADHIAVRLGFHPSLLWPQWWDSAPVWTEEVAA